MSDAHRPVLQVQDHRSRAVALQSTVRGEPLQSAAWGAVFQCPLGQPGKSVVGCLGLDFVNSSLCTYLCFVTCKSDNKHEYLLKFYLSFCVFCPHSFHRLSCVESFLPIILVLVEKTTSLCQANTKQTNSSHKQ